MKKLAIFAVLAAVPFSATMTTDIRPAYACNIPNPPAPCANFPGADPIAGIGTIFQEQYRPIPGTSPFATDPFFPFRDDFPWFRGVPPGDPDPENSVMDEITSWQFRSSQPRRLPTATLPFLPDGPQPGDYGYVPNLNPYENPFFDAANADGFAPRYVVLYNDLGAFYVVYDTETKHVVASRGSAEEAEDVRRGILDKSNTPPKPRAGAKTPRTTAANTPNRTEGTGNDNLWDDFVQAAIDSGFGPRFVVSESAGFDGGPAVFDTETGAQQSFYPGEKELAERLAQTLIKNSHIGPTTRGDDAPVPASAPAAGTTDNTAPAAPTGVSVVPDSNGTPTILINGTPFKERLGVQHHLQRLPGDGQMDEEITLMQTEDGKVWGIGADGHNFGSMHPSRNQFFEGKTVYSFDSTPVQRSMPAAIRNAALTTDAQTVPPFSDGFESGDTSAWTSSQP